MNFYAITFEQACAANLPAVTRDDLLMGIARQAAKAPALRRLSEDEIYRGLREREEQGSTGFGRGIAIPHARFDRADDFVLFVVTSRRGVPFNALDKKRVKVFIVLIGPSDKVREHLQILAGISNILTHTPVQRELLQAVSRSALYETFLRRTREKKPVEKTENQKLLIVVLYEDRFFYDLLEFYLEEGIDGATVLESSGMGQYISNIPLFASFIGFMNEDKNRSRTILALVPESRLSLLIQGIERITGDLDKKQGAMILALDVALAKGTMKMM